ncbi:MAG: peptidase S16, partial [Pseudomonadota bacterium]|nr:peptidase S16 [Pseudomonadota bacterium]
RVLEVNYDQFADDVLMDSELILDRSSIFDILPKYLDSQGLKLRIDAIEALSDLDLILTLSMICPFNTREKQALLESKSFSDRADMLLALLQMGVFGNSETDEVFQ